jgi:hypothetical protein
MSRKTLWNPGKEPDKLRNLKGSDMSDKPLWNLVKGLDKSGQGLSR